MWKLYKQMTVVVNSPVEQLVSTIVMESDSIDSLKSEARRLAILGGCSANDQFWVRIPDLNYYELNLDDKCKFIIRES
jgi:hypothetical protein